MASRTDSVYQLTLTELAFVIVFLILLLSGWMLARSEADQAAELTAAEQGQIRTSELAQGAGEIQRLEELNRALTESERALRQLLAERSGADPDAIVSELIAQQREAATGETLRLKQRIEALDAEVSALTEIRSAAASNQEGAPSPQRPARDLVAADAFKTSLEQALGEPIARGLERETGREFGRLLRQLKPDRAASGTRSQSSPTATVTTTGKPDPQFVGDGRGGRDFPPCWTDPVSRKPQYLLTVFLTNGGIRSEPAWPPERGAEAGGLPGLKRLAGGGALKIDEFRNRARPLVEFSDAHRCRHYVRIVNQVTNLPLFNRLRYAVEEYFYKFEVR
jgi:hypothetical protein